MKCEISQTNDVKQKWDLSISRFMVSNKKQWSRPPQIVVY